MMVGGDPARATPFVIGYALLEDLSVLDRHLQLSKLQDFRKFPGDEIMSYLAPCPSPGVETKTLAEHVHSSRN